MNACSLPDTGGSRPRRMPSAHSTAYLVHLLAASSESMVTRLINISAVSASRKALTRARRNH